MQINDAQFLSAFRHIVKAESDTIAPGSYRMHGRSGAAYCVIGRALEMISKDLVPRDNTMLARELLVSLGCNPHVGEAARMAQYANDSGCTYAESGEVFEAVLTMAEHNCSLMDIESTTLGMVKAAQRRRQMKMERELIEATAASTKKVQAQMEALSQSIGQATASLGKITVTFNSTAMTTVTMPTIDVPKTGFTYAGYVTKKDHALVA